jgi:hypothetical protein
MPIEAALFNYSALKAAMPHLDAVVGHAPVTVPHAKAFHLKRNFKMQWQASLMPALSARRPANISNWCGFESVSTHIVGTMDE